MSNPIEDWAEECHRIALAEKNRVKDSYECEACGKKFIPEDEEGGMVLPLEYEYYCPGCVKYSMHIAYIRNYAPSTEEALFIINSLKYI